MSGIANYLNDKTLLITGTTGFLAKGIVEKLFRQAPDIRRVYLACIRPKRLKNGTTLSAEERMEKEIFQSSVFDRLRGIHGDRLLDILREKTIPVEGDLTQDHLGIDPDVYEQLTKQVQVVIACAASVAFDEEVDYAMKLNALGARRVMEFAKACDDAVLIHVSTAFVSGNRRGSVPELPPEPDRSMAQEIGLNQTPFNLDDEIKDIFAFAGKAHEDAHSEEQKKAFRRAALRQNSKPSQRWLDAQIETYRKRWLKKRLADEGIRRSKSWGWHDIYTMTKAMGEQMIVKYREDLPVAIVRPSIVEGSLVEPEPGWVEDLKVADPLIDAISRGRLPDFPADPEIVLDVVPVDIVANTVLAAIPRTAKEGGVSVFQVATGDLNPIKISRLYDLVYDYFQKNPRLDKKGDPIPIKRWRYPTLDQFKRQCNVKYTWPLGIAQWCLERLSWNAAANRWRQRANVIKSAITRMLYYAEIYSPYTTLDCTFETRRTAQLHESLDPEDQAVFNCDVGRIRWEEYIQDIHIPGLQRYVLKIEQPAAKDDTEEAEVAERSGFNEYEPDALPHLDTITDILNKSAGTYGAKTALQMKQGDTWVRYSYNDVHALAGHMGWHWRQNGLHPGERVLLFSENKPEWGIAYFAAMVAGATVVPIDRQTPPREIWALARFTKARAILCSEESISVLGAGDDIEVFLWNIDNYGRSFGEEPLPESPINSDSDPPSWATVEPNTMASIIFTKGTAVDPRGAMLTHGNFVSDLLALADVLRAYRTDQFLSLLPLNHALEFTGGFLMPFYAGATITYADTLKTRVLVDLMSETNTTCILSVPRIFRLLYERLRKTAEPSIDGNGAGRPSETVIGRLRLLVSGGAALSPDLYEAYRQMGLTIYEGYGLTETAPILTVNPPERSKPASVGQPLPGIDLHIKQPDDDGCGEVVVRGPNVMAGYLENPIASAEYLRDGWLYTGDIGRLDEDNYLYITGRIKDLIVTGAGKNVYPDEVECFYQSVPYTKEFRIVGVLTSQTMSEDIHAVLVPDWDAYPGAQDIETYRADVIETVQAISKSLPSYQRIQHVHIWDGQIPDEEDGQQRRARYRTMLSEKIQSEQNGATETTVDDEDPAGVTWDQAVYGVIGQLTNRPVAELIVKPNRSLDDLMDSLMRLELLAALETRFNTTIPDTKALQVHTVQDVLNTVQHSINPDASVVSGIDRPVDTSAYWEKVLHDENGTAKKQRPRRGLAQRVFWFVGRLMYHTYFGLTYRGLEHLPKNSSFIVAANHCSHLDSGAIITALWRKVDRMSILGAKDYFFDTPLKTWFFKTIMDAVPFDRHENVVSGLQVSSQVLSPTTPILIYPEGTRSITGELQPLKVGLGLLAFELNVPIVPAYIRGTFQALPKGRSIPRSSRIEVAFGPPIEMGSYRKKKGTRMNYGLYKEVIDQVRASIEHLRDDRAV